MTMLGRSVALCILSSSLASQDLIVGTEKKVSETVGGFTGILDPSDNFGRAVTFVDGPGIMAVGAPLDDTGGVDQGAVWLLTFLAGSVASNVEIAEGLGGFSGTLDPSDRFGSSVAAIEAGSSIGDLNADGVSDLVVGAPGDDDGGVDKGAVWILFMNANGTVNSDVKISETSGQGFTGPLLTGDAFGDAVCSLGDLDSDGVPDLAVGASNAGTTHTGELWILLLNADGSVKAQQQIAPGVGGFVGPLGPNDDFGLAVSAFDASIGDLDGDGISDLAVGAPGDDDGGSDRGAAWILFLDAAGLVTGEQKISSTSGGLTGPLANVDNFGWGVCSLGVVQGNYQLAVGAPGDDAGGVDQGAIWVLALDTAGTVLDEGKIIEGTTGCAGFDGPLDPADQIGQALAALNNGNNTFDLAVGVGNDDDGGTDQGAIWVLGVKQGQFAAASVLHYNSLCTPNSDILTATKAIIGAPWSVSVVRSPVTMPGGLTLILRPTRIPVPCGVAAPPPIVGRLLVSGVPLGTFTGVHNGTNGVMNFIIPCVDSLVGLHWTCQAFLSVPGVELSSAAEGTVGAF